MTRKTDFFEWWSWFKFNYLGVALGTKLKFYTSVAKGQKLKMRKILGLILTFVEVTGEKLVGGPPSPPSILNRVKVSLVIVLSIMTEYYVNLLVRVTVVISFNFYITTNG